MTEKRKPNDDSKREELYKAMDCALLSLAELHAATEARSKEVDQVSEERISELSQLIWKNIGSNTRESDLGNVTLPHWVAATLLRGIKDLERQIESQKQIRENRDELLQKLTDAYNAFDDKRVTDYKKAMHCCRQRVGFQTQQTRR